MPKYRVHFKKIIYGHYEPISADDENEAREFAEDGDWAIEQQDDPDDCLDPEIVEVDLIREKDAE